ncbi:unnamed protein product [Caenorhabditis bovis]|uniref:Uncharacterized protein n=1 Tax=Caenorhabditis bovis TaxID=2654633 RepID=A0A8S1EH04_9PELO|nr:unnamed protein product [Caenorhabditis bovis]
MMESDDQVSESSSSATDSDSETDDDLNICNHYIRAGHEGCDEYTELTTFHGMIRVFNSKNWPSLIFWCLVVTTCLVFYMIVCGLMISTYSKQHSFQRKNSEKNAEQKFDVEICSKYLYNCPNSSNFFLSCHNENSKCINASFINHLKLENIPKSFFLKINRNPRKWYFKGNPGIHHRLRLKHIQIHRLNLVNSNCYDSWDSVPWIITSPNESYSLEECEIERRRLYGEIRDIQECYQCYPPCVEDKIEVIYSRTFVNKNSSVISMRSQSYITVVHEIRKTGIVDILSNLGGASSLFMGCSCITLLEMFIFLFKLVFHSLLSKDVGNNELAPEEDKRLTSRRRAIIGKDFQSYRQTRELNGLLLRLLQNAPDHQNK